MDKHGQIDMRVVMGVVGILIAIIVGAFVFTKIQEETERAAAGTGTTYTYKTVNPEFTSDASGWENVVVQDAAVNAWDSGGYVKVSTTENDTIRDIGEWKQKLNVANLYDRVDAADQKYAYSVLSVTGIGTGDIKVQLILEKPDGSRVVLHEVVTTTTIGWTMIENDIKNHTTAAGDHWIVMRADMLATSTTPNLVVGFDNATLRVDAYELSVGEKAAGDIGDIGGTIFSMLAILALIGIVFLLIWMFARPS